LGPIHDTLRFCSFQIGRFPVEPGHTPCDENYAQRFYRFLYKKGCPHQLSDLHGIGKRNGESGRALGGFDPAVHGRHREYPRTSRRSLSHRH
jgi:hypothetical protein